MKLRKRKMNFQTSESSEFSFSNLSKKTKNVTDKGKHFFLYPKIITFLMLVTLGLITVRIYYSNQLALSGAKVSYIQNKVVELKKENADLENVISQKSSLSFIETKAQELGMVKVNKVEVIKPIAPVALNQ